jgi:hypothetical protein
VAAAALALVAWPPTRDDARLPPVVAALALAAWAVLDAALLGVPAAGAGPALLLLALVAVLLVCRRLQPEDREVLLGGVIAVGLLVALTGWLGVADRVGPWAWLGDGIWRASSTLTYPNAAAAVLVPVALVALARLVDAPGSLPLALAATGLLAGAAATLSRAAALALAVGLVVLAGLRGPRRAARVALGPCVGALVALVGLVPSMPAAGPARPALALAGLGAGLALAAVLARRRGVAAVVLVLGGVLLGCLTVAVVAGGVGDAARLVADTRITLASPDRSGAVGAALRWRPSTRSSAPDPDRWTCDREGQTVAPGSSATPTTSTPRSPRSSAWWAWRCSRSWWSRSPGCCGARAPPARRSRAGRAWSRRRRPSPSTAASTSSGTCQRWCSP